MTTPPKPSADISFGDLGLSDSILKALNEVGYETPSPIQARTIPFILAGTDVLAKEVERNTRVG